eukprot:jgi/Hompol1/4016/HPOL_006988-RA
MTTQRWYPTVVTLADGSQMVIGGSTDAIDFDNLKPINNPTYEYWPAKTGDWPKTLQILTWAFPHMLYPMAQLMPSGKVFLFVSNKSIAIDPVTDTVSYPVSDLLAADHAPWIYPHMATMTVLPMTIKNNFQFTVQICGGSKNSTEDASPLCYQTTPDIPGSEWTRVDDMPNARLMPDSAILPDGKILYVNGAGWGQAGGDPGLVQYAHSPVMTADLFDPEAPAGKRWTSLANATNYRLYHSGVVLLETGHVVTAGSQMDNLDDYWKYNKTTCMPNVSAFGPECTSPFNYNIERFAPPYLQLAERQGRPVISSAPATLTHNSTF